MAGDRGYLDTDTVTAADIRRAWPHMREICGLVATSACCDELIRQAVCQARAREAGDKVPAPARPNRAALFAQVAPTPTLQREGQRRDEIVQAASLPVDGNPIVLRPD